MNQVFPQLLYKFTYIRGECQPSGAALWSVWKCWIEARDENMEWKRFAYGHKVEFRWSQYMGTYRYNNDRIQL